MIMARQCGAEKLAPREPINPGTIAAHHVSSDGRVLAGRTAAMTGAAIANG